MHVCHVIPELPPGGAEGLLLDLVRNSSGIEFSVVYLGGDDTLKEPLLRVGAEVHGLQARFGYDPIAYARLCRLIHRSDFDIIHAHLPTAQWIARICAVLTGSIPVVSTQHAFPGNHGPIDRSLERITRRLDAVTVAISESQRRAYGAEWSGRWETIHNGIDVEKFAARVEESDIDEIVNTFDLSGKTVYLNVGRCVPEKNQELTIRAFAKTVNAHPATHLFIVGGGPLRGRLSELAKTLGIADSVTLVGRREDVERFFAAADVLVHTPTSEGFGIVLVEAMAARLPIVATRLPAILEVVGDGEAGKLVPPNTDGLSSAMGTLRDEDLRREIGNRGYNRAIDRFTIHKTLNAYLRVYRDLVENQAAPR